MKKKLKEILNVISNCPAMYSQNIEHKNFKYRKFCVVHKFIPNGSFLKCPMWKNRLDCWKAINDWDDRCND